MKVYGLATAAEFLGDFIAYRNLEPQQPGLPGLRQVTERLGLPAGRVPRKHELDYARVVAEILAAARQMEAPGQPLERLVFVGDSELLDGTAFANLCLVTGWPGLAFIGDESQDAPAFRVAERPPGRVYLANRWAALEEFDRFCAHSGQPLGPRTAVVIDLDKTILGARGRNGKRIDQARSSAMQQTLSALLDQFDAQCFIQVYQQFSAPAFHPFTSDNQDYLAYICLMALAGRVDIARLAQAVLQGQIANFEQFIAEMEALRDEMPPRLAQAHTEVHTCVLAGDPTPFKAFRRNEYRVTAGAMGCLPQAAPVEELLRDELVLTQEVRQKALEWKHNGALLFGLSDKPDEASVPTAELAAQGWQPLHRTPTHAVGV